MSYFLGGVESTEPTKMLMRIAEYIDTGSDELRQWFLKEKKDVLDLLQHQQKTPITEYGVQLIVVKGYSTVLVCFVCLFLYVRIYVFASLRLDRVGTDTDSL